MLSDYRYMKEPSESYGGREPYGLDLKRCACDLVEAFKSGRLPELQQTGWTATWKYLMKDLRTACPGYSEVEYGIALNHALISQ